MKNTAGALRLRALLAFASLLLISFPAAAEYPWVWGVQGQTPTFATKAEAVAYMHSLTHLDPRYPQLTVERRATETTALTVRYRYEAPRVPPIPVTWRYFDNVWGAPNTLFSEEAWVADRVARHPSPAGCPAATLVPQGPWVTTHTSYGGSPTRENRPYRRTLYGSSSCIVTITNITAIREDVRECPAGYVGEAAPPGCRINFTATINGRRNYSEGCPPDKGVRANPCSALTGDKSETVRDYTGPYGLKLERHYHSKNEETFNRLGVGWSHNYQARLLVLSNGALEGIIRPDGYHESFSNQSSPYFSVNGIVIKKSGSTHRAYLNDGTIETYDGSGDLVSIQHPNGGVTTLSYFWEQLTTVTGPFGHKLQFQYDEDDHLQRVVLPDGEAIEYSYTGENLTSVLYPDDTTVTYHYEDTNFPGHLTGVTDQNSARFSTFAYDSMGRATLSKHAGDVEQYTIAYNATNSVVTDPLGTQETISFTATSTVPRRVMGTTKGGLTRTYTVPGTSTDARRRVTQIVDPRGLVTKYTYGTHHRTSMIEAFGTPLARTTTYQYLNNDSDLPTLITEPNRTTANTYGTNNVLLTRTITDTTVTPNVSRTWTYTYDTNGRILTEDGPRTDVSDVTTYTYYTCTTGNECGQINSVTNALSQTTTFNTYNAHGQPLTINDANGVVTTLTYDLRQRLTTRTIGSETTSFEYWPTGLLKKATLPDGSFTLYTYDAAHRLIEVEDGEGNRIEYTLDAVGNRTAENTYDPSSALARTRTQVFDNLSRLWKQVASAGTSAVTSTLGYDNNGNQTSVNAPLGRNSTQLYDELDRLKQINDPASGITQFAYDANDNLTSVTDPKGLVTSYTYNGFGDLTQQVSPDTGTTVNTYDSGGDLATSTDARGKVGTYTYDPLNRVTSIAYPDRTLTFTYDSGTNGAGRLTGASDASHSLAWSYDAQGRVIGKGQTVGSLTKSVGYGYADGNLTSLVTPSGQTITYVYINGRVSSITLNGSTTILNNVLYEPFGPVSGWTWGNSTLAVRVYDLDGNPTDIDSAGAYTYAYDDAFRITGVTDVTDSNKTWSYGYDLLDRLNAASRTAETIGYTYDANGNRLTQTGTSAASYTVSGTSNRVTSITGTPTRIYGYDASGNTTGYGALTFTYSDAGRMSAVTDGTVTTTYLHNAVGQRVKKSNATMTVHFVYDESGRLLGEYDAIGALIQETIWMGDIPVATLRLDGSGVTHYYVHTDHLDTPRRISRPSDNAVLWRWDSDPFGATAANEDPDGDSIAFTYSLRFPGQYLDAESGLSHNYFRDYDAGTGRFIQSDPIGLWGGINTYAYVRGTPLSRTDRFGLYDDATGTYTRTIVRTVTRCLASTGAMTTAIAGGLVAMATPTPTSACDTMHKPDSCFDECDEITREIYNVMNEVQKRIGALLTDRCNLYVLAHSVANPNLPAGCFGTWLGHIQQVENWQTRLLNLIGRAQGMGCPVPADAWSLATRPLPKMPRGFHPGGR